MFLIKPSFEILTPITKDIYKNIEIAGRVCYKSEDRITDDSSEKFVRGIIKSGHDSVLEHQSVSVRLICDRGVSHELVRHRIASYSQESTRYCNYRGGVTFIIPPWVDIPVGEYKPGDDPANNKADALWFNACLNDELYYLELLKCGWTSQQARDVLGISVKTEIIMTMNLREWRHFFNLRAVGTTGKPHPQMSEITVPLLDKFKSLLLYIFEDII